MQNKEESIRKILDYLNNPSEDGGFWLPNIQRSFVWKEEQICRLFDSILREYPMGTLLIWKTNSDIKRRKFIDNWDASLKLSSFYVPEDTNKKCLVLDGQQRLQSLFIGLMGSFAGKELYFDILSGNPTTPDEMKYRFSFEEKDDAKFPLVKFKDLIDRNTTKHGTRKKINKKTDLTFSEEDSVRIDSNLDLILRVFTKDLVVTYQELDSIDNPLLYNESDIVEIFIRSNSGGTKLEKSDLLFSLLSSSWDDAEKRMEILLEQLNRPGFKFDRDFILKTCLVLLNQGAQYEVSKFRKQGVRESIENNWSELSDSIKAVVDYVRTKTAIQNDKALSSYLALIPFIYVRHHFRSKWEAAKDKHQFLITTLLAGSFGGSSDSVIDALTKRFREIQGFDSAAGYDVIRQKNRSVEIHRDTFFQMGYGSKYIYLIFNLWYKGSNYTPIYHGNSLEVDHIFPKSLLKGIKVKNPATNRMVMKYHDAEIDQLANCMLLTQAENGPNGKWDQSPLDWFEKQKDEYLNLHLIPKDKELWKEERFEDFIEERKKLIAKKFAVLITDAPKKKVTR